jgi:hypothetical protein
MRASAAETLHRSKLATRLDSRSLTIVLTIFVAANLGIGQTQPKPKKKAINPAKQQTSNQEIGKSYFKLQPHQERWVAGHVSHRNQTTGSKIVAQEAYDSARLPAASRAAKITMARSPLYFTQCCNSQSSAWTRRSSFSPIIRGEPWIKFFME